MLPSLRISLGIRAHERERERERERSRLPPCVRFSDHDFYHDSIISNLELYKKGSLRHK